MDPVAKKRFGLAGMNSPLIQYVIAALLICFATREKDSKRMVQCFESKSDELKFAIEYRLWFGRLRSFYVSWHFPAVIFLTLVISQPVSSIRCLFLN